MNILIFLFAIEMGYSPMNISRIETDIDYKVNLWDISLEPEVILFDYLHIYGKADIKMLPETRTFYPMSIESTFKASFQYKGLELGYEHLCIHPIVPGSVELFYPQVYDETNNRFYIRFESGNK